MSETQSYKTVTFSPGELHAVAHALDVRVITLLAMIERHPADKALCERLIDESRAALAKVEAAL